VFRAVTKIILVFKYLLKAYKNCLQIYKSVIYNKHNKLPKDYLVINLYTALLKAYKYYNKLNLLPAYYTATILYSCYKYYLNTV
jgi:hypothetical protein